MPKTPHDRKFWKRIRYSGELAGTFKNSFPDLSVPTHGVAPLSHGVGNPIPRKDLLTEHLRPNAVPESPETLAATARKATRIAPAYNKGAYQYIGDIELTSPIITSKK